jgi:transcriptional regulator with XRE-family HTH domain
MESLMRALGADIRRARWQSGLSQAGLEVLSGVDQTTISRLENGLAPGLRLIRLVKILGPIGLGSLTPSPVSERLKVTPWDSVL